jgi:hypothetical protein
MVTGKPRQGMFMKPGALFNLKNNDFEYVLNNNK